MRQPIKPLRRRQHAKVLSPSRAVAKALSARVELPNDVDEPPDDRRDAARWRALMQHIRLRIMTEVAQPHANLPKGASYLMLEMWTDDEMPTTRPNRAKFIDYVDRARRRK